MIRARPPAVQPCLRQRPIRAGRSWRGTRRRCCRRRQHGRAHMWHLQTRQVSHPRFSVEFFQCLSLSSVLSSVCSFLPFTHPPKTNSALEHWIGSIPHGTGPHEHPSACRPPHGLPSAYTRRKLTERREVYATQKKSGRVVPSAGERSISSRSPGPPLQLRPWIIARP